MHPTTTFLAVLGAASTISAHMMIGKPVPFGKSTLNNSPLAADGSDYPCKQRPGVYDAEGADNQMPLGSTQPLSFVGSATHGGGSCQVSVTYDLEPNANSQFRVIHSIEGGCPVAGVAGNTGNNPDATNPDYHFTVPNDLPTGKAVIAWTWFNKIGNREMYMNCAPVTFTGGNAKRSARMQARSQDAFSNLPAMFKANIGGTCRVPDSVDVAFPDPGESVEKLGMNTMQPASPSGDCGAQGNPGSAGGAGGQPSATTSAAASVATGSASSAVPIGAPSVTANSAVAGPSGAPSLGGVFITVDSSNASSGAASKTTSAPSVSSATASAVSVPPVAPSSGAKLPNDANGTSNAVTNPVSNVAGAQKGACTPEGMWNCIDGSSYQQCASGTWSTVMQMAAGTTCQSGQTKSFTVAKKVQ